MNIYRGMNKKEIWRHQAITFFLVLIAVIFFVELGIMVALENWIHLSGIKNGLFDAGILVLVILPVIYYIFFKPLRDSNIDLRKFKLATEFASDHIIITDSGSKILFVNKAAEDTTGYSIDEMIGQTPRLWGGQMPVEFYKNLYKTINIDKKIFKGEIVNRKKNGESYQAEVHIAPVLDDKNNVVYFVGIEHDITKIKQIDKSKSEFVSLASHQLRTPLSAINWYTEMLIDEDVGQLNDKQKEYLREIYHSSKRMGDLVGSLLNVSRIELGTFIVDPKPTNMVDLIKSVIKDLALQIERKKQKLIENYGNVGMLDIDSNIMQMIVQNLLSNAVKYTPDEGEIRISIHKNGSIVINISDNGIGIPQNQQSHIFTKFFRADNAKEKETDGNGLGLYIVKEMVNKTGGRIWFESEINKGTTFHVSLPLTGMVPKTGKKQIF